MHVFKRDAGIQAGKHRKNFFLLEQIIKNFIQGFCKFFTKDIKMYQERKMGYVVCLEIISKQKTKH